MVQWVPARTATPARSITVAMSWGCAPSMVNDRIAPCWRAWPIIRSRLMADSRRSPAGEARPHAPQSGRGHGHHIIEGDAEPDRLDDRGGPRLEPVRWIGIGDLVEKHLPDHLATALIGRHPLEMTSLGVKDAYPCGP